MQLSTVLPIAEQLVDAMRPYAEQIQIAGSIRRQKAEVKDIEIVVVPRWDKEIQADGMFEHEVSVNRLHTWGELSASDMGLQWIKPGTPNVEPWPIKESGKYWRGYMAEHDIKVDVFLAHPGNWGTILLIRTGSAEFSQAVMSHTLRKGMRFTEGHLENENGRPVPTRTEESVFEALGLKWVEPQDRTGAEAVRPVQGGGNHA